MDSEMPIVRLLLALWDDSFYAFPLDQGAMGAKVASPRVFWSFFHANLNKKWPKRFQLCALTYLCSPCNVDSSKFDWL